MRRATTARTASTRRRRRPFSARTRSGTACSFEDINYDNINQRTGPTFTAPERQVTATGAQISILPEITGLGQIYRVTRANFVSARQTRQQYTSFFVQDTFTLGNRLTVKPGIRYEQQKLIGQLVSATGTADNDFTLDGNWAPRIGATYDILGNGRSKIFANWGRFYAKIPNDLAARALSADAGDQPRRLLRPESHAADSGRPTTVTQTPGGDPQTTINHFQQQGLSPDIIDPEREVVLCRRVRRRPRVRSVPEHQPWRAIHPSVDSACAGGRRELPGRRVRHRGRRLQFRLHPDEPGTVDAG